ncbi:MAG: HAMP domain-containing histidine kinase [Pedobacter sp.]|nr:MAG: HAMP domain-containing histidine kinase [Pedobacter sp.]
MRKNANLLIIICFVAMSALLALQAYWIVKYYRLTKTNFEKEVNLAFEDGIKKELSLRCDTVQKIIENKILDSSAFQITAKLDEKEKKYVYTLSATGNTKDKFSSSFTLNKMNKPIKSGDKEVKNFIAKKIALMMRTEDLETHTIYYRTQSLGTFMSEEVEKHQFDTTRLRKAFNIYLKQRNIDVPYSFLIRKEDSTTNKSGFKASLLKKYPIITKSFSTYRYTDDQAYVRAMFRDPFSYILSGMGLIFFASLGLVILLSASMIFILKSLFREKRLSAIKNDFISNITHEFKTPIATVTLAVEALSNSAVINDKEKSKRYIEHAKTEIERLNLLVDKVMNLAIYEDGHSEINKENINIDDVINDLIRLHQLTENKKVVINYENKSGHIYIHADKTQFQHAVNNILDNAIKYSKDDALIEISISEKDDFLILTLKDNGIGIADREIPLVFDKFYRVGTGNNHLVKGYGLGLNYVKQIMEQHSGWCSIESKPGYGTTLILGWPI